MSNTQTAKAKRSSMITGNPTKPLLLFTLPMIAGNMFQQIYLIIDSIIVGKFVGREALAAVGASAAISTLFVMVAMGTGIGCSVIISQLFGAKKMKQMKTAISTALIAIFIFAVLLSIMGMFTSHLLLGLMGTPSDIFADANGFLKIYFYGFVFMFLYNAFSAIFNALGDSMKPLVFLLISSVINIALDFLFVLHFHMGVPGVAWATLIAQGFSAVLSGVVLLRKLKTIESEPFLRFEGAMLKTMVQVAVPTILQQSIVSIGMLLIQAAVNRLGSSFLAGYTAAIRIDGMAIVPMVAVGNAMSTYVAQNMGANKPDRIKIGYRICLVMAAGIGLLIAGILHFFGHEIMGLFMDSATAADSILVGVEYLGTVSLFYFVMGMMNVSNGVLRGAADMRWFLACSLAILIVRTGLTYALVDATGGMIIRYANPAAWLVGLVIAVFRYFQGGWKSKQLI